MSPPVRVALLGFTPFEREYLEPAMRAVRRRLPSYAVRADDLPGCSLAVVDADHEPAVVQVRHQCRLASTVMVGSTPRPGAGAQLARPIHVPSLLLALDALVAAAPAMSAEVQRVQDTLASLLAPRRAAESATPARAAASPPPAWPVIAAPARTEAGPHRGSVLLVGARAETLRFLAVELAPSGLDVQRAASGDEALMRLQHEVFEFVFLATGEAHQSPQNAARPGEAQARQRGHETAPDEMDGFHTCRLLQRLPPAQPVAPPPTLVLLLSDDSAVDRLRAERAGADAWLTPPWSAQALLKVVEERERWLQQSGKR